MWKKGYDIIYLLTNIFLISILQNAAGWALVQKVDLREERRRRTQDGVDGRVPQGDLAADLLPAGLGGLLPAVADGNRGQPALVFALVSFKVLPIGLAGLMMLAMLGSAFSAMGAEYDTLSGVLTRDFYKRMLRPQASSTAEVSFGRWATLGIGALTMAIACLFNFYRELNLMDLMMRFFGAFGPPTMIPVFLGLLTKRFNSRGVWYGVLSGITFGVILVAINLYLMNFVYAEQMKTDEMLDYRLRTLYGGLISVGTSVVVLLGMCRIGSSLHPRSAAENQEVEKFFADLKEPY